MSTKYCNKPTINEAPFCEECVREAVAKNKEFQKDFQSYYNHIDNDRPPRISTEAEEGKCCYRYARGQYRGWYCSTLCENGEEYCEKCREMVANRFYRSDEQNTTEKGLCHRVVEVI